MLSAIVVVIVFSIIVVVHEFGHFIMAKRCGVKVERFSIGFGPRLIAIKKGETEYRLSAIPLGGYVKMAGETYQDKLLGKEWEFLSKNPGVRFKIIISGPLLNYILGFLLFTLVFMMGAPTMTNKVGKVLDGYPAKASGIEAGDRVISIDGETIESWDELTEIMHKKLEGKVRLIILRNDNKFELELMPMVKEFKDIFGKDVKMAMVGIAPSNELMYIRYNFFQAVYKGVASVFKLTVVTFKTVWFLIIGRLSLKESVAGPVYIFALTANAARLGLVYLFNLMAVISTSLAIFNILPIPVLDGGHLVFLAIEKLRRRPLSPKVQDAATQVGLSLLILLMLFVFYFDLMRIFGKQ